ncbi:MAG: hypothetical protein ACYS47_00990 [Planctomycetota bacterium]|jgi:hypothetical protein
MAVKGYILGDKARKDLNCRVPRLIDQGKIESARNCVGKYQGHEDSPLLMAHRIAVLEAAGEAGEARRIFRNRKKFLKGAARKGPKEVEYFFVHLFSHYLKAEDVKTAEKVARASREYGLEKSRFGVLWFKYYDMTGRIDEGIAAMRAFFKGRKKLGAPEIAVLKSRYPRLTKDKRFARIQE